MMSRKAAALLLPLIWGLFFMVTMGNSEETPTLPFKPINNIKTNGPIMEAGFLGNTDLFYAITSTDIFNYDLTIYEANTGKEIFNDDCFVQNNFIQMFGERIGKNYRIIVMYELHACFPYIYQTWMLTPQGEHRDYEIIGSGSWLSEISKDGRYLLFGEGASAGEGAGETLLYDTRTRSNSEVCDVASSGACIYSFSPLRVAVADDETKTVGYYEKRGDHWTRIHLSEKLDNGAIISLEYLPKINKILVHGDSSENYYLLDDKGKIAQNCSECEIYSTYPLKLKKPYTEEGSIIYDGKGKIKSIYELGDLGAWIKKELTPLVIWKEPYEMDYRPSLSNALAYQKQGDDIFIYHTPWYQVEK
jgi:hypothetical protein